MKGLLAICVFLILVAIPSLAQQPYYGIFYDSSGPADSASVAISGPGGRLLYTTSPGGITIINVTTNENFYSFTTNILFASTNYNFYSFVTNILFSTTNYNKYTFVTNILFSTTNYNNYSFVTNVLVSSKIYNSYFYITNNFYLTISAWPGATNNYDLSLVRQQYTMTTACAVTNFNNVPGTGTELGSVLTLTNSTGGDLIVYFTAGGITTDDGARSYTVTNKTQRAFSIRVADTGTNVIARTFY